jgi:hypothetical protein
MAFVLAALPAIMSGAGAAASGLSAASILSGAAGALGALTTLAGGAADRAKARGEAIIEEQKATQEEIAGRQRANEINDQMLDRLAQARVAMAGNNISLAGPLNDQVTGDAVRRTGATLASNERQFTIAARTRRAQAMQLREAGAAAAGVSAVSAVGQLASTASGIIKRG